MLLAVPFLSLHIRLSVIPERPREVGWGCPQNYATTAVNSRKELMMAGHGVEALALLDEIHAPRL